MRKLNLILVLALAAVGCGTERYGFRPTATVGTTEAGFPASHYSIPPGSPRGEVYVTSFGTREVQGNAGQQSQLIHIRFAVANQMDDRAWTVDPSRQMLASPMSPPQHPDFMEVDGRAYADTAIARGQRKVFDLYYRMPGGAPDARGLPGFDFQWQVATGGQTVAEHTPFAREPYQDYSEANRQYVAVGYASPWWFGWYGPPWWGWYGGWYGWGPYPRYYYGGYGPRTGVGYRPYGGGGGFRGSARVGPVVRGGRR